MAACGCIMGEEAMVEDQQLLREYAVGGSEAAFGELVARYINLVYSAALRRAGGDTHLAQDVAQLVFTDLARKACSLPKSVVLAGWLHRATYYAAAQLLRTERRRQAREQEAVAMNALTSEPAPDWEQIRPLLDEALDRLDQADRDALLLRFFEQRSLAEVGHALGSNEDAARKRVTRALEKLRGHLVRRGVTTPAAALSTVISVHAVQTAPAGLAAALTTTSLAGAAAGTGATLTVVKLMAMTKLKFGLVCALVVAGVATPLVIQHHANVTLREENQSLRQQTEQLAPLAAENERLSNLVSRSNSSSSLPDGQLSELLRLRGELTRLRAAGRQQPPPEPGLSSKPASEDSVR
jgi:RNA polymerase sigma factor (sigma-70 family)